LTVLLKKGTRKDTKTPKTARGAKATGKLTPVRGAGEETIFPRLMKKARGEGASEGLGGNLV